MKCSNCNKVKCRNGADCKWNNEGNCRWCHCEEKVDKICQNDYQICDNNHISPCEICEEQTCNNCSDMCEQCSKEICGTCGSTCIGCDDWYCNSHLVETSNWEFRTLCADCYEEMKDLVHGDYSKRDGHEY